MSNTVLLKDIADIITGPFGSQLHESDYVPEGIPSIMPQNIGNRILNYDGIARITEKDAKRLSRYLVKENDIVYARRGDVEKHAFISAQDEGALCGTGCLRVRIISDAVYPTYLSHFLNRPETRRWITLHAVGSNMPNINTDILGAVPIELPAYETQKAIADMLSDFDKKINLNTRLCAELEAMAKTLYDYWFVQFDFPDENGKPYRTSGGAMEWCQELGREVPKRWKPCIIGELLAPIPNTARIQTGEYKKEGTVPIIDQSTSFIAGYTNDESALLCSDSGYIVFGDHTRIVKYIRFPFARGADGTQIIDSNSPCMPNELFYQTIRSIDLSNQGYARHYKFLKETMILIPDETIAKLYQKTVSPLYDKITKIVFENVELEKLRDWLLPMLMNGQVNIDLRKGKLPWS